MKYRFQSTATIDKASYHPYPTSDILYAYKNQEAVSSMVSRIEDGEIDWDCASEVDDIENYILDGYVCCHHSNLGEEDLKDVMEFENSGMAASDDYVILFWEGEEDNIFDGEIATVEEVVAVYKKQMSNTYKKIS